MNYITCTVYIFDCAVNPFAAVLTSGARHELSEPRRALMTSAARHTGHCVLAMCGTAGTD